MRMNCQPVAKLFPEFQLNGVHNIGFSVAEVELHTLGMICELARLQNKRQNQQMVINLLSL